MIFLKLFLTFLKIGLVTFGGGYAMLPLIQESAIDNNWLTESEMLDLIAIAESTPGPISINLATFIGAKQGGIFGALVSTLGVAFPAFVFILLISIFIKEVAKNSFLKSVIDKIKPVISALIISVAVAMFLSIFFSIKTVYHQASFDYLSLILFVSIITIYCVYYKIRKKEISPIFLIIISGIAGMLMFGL